MIANGEKLQHGQRPALQFRHVSSEQDSLFDRPSHVALMLPKSQMQFEKQNKVFLGGLSNYNGYKPHLIMHKTWKLQLPVCQRMKDRYKIKGIKYSK